MADPPRAQADEMDAVSINSDRAELGAAKPAKAWQIYGPEDLFYRADKAFLGSATPIA
jgi:hypothetical protein